MNLDKLDKRLVKIRKKLEWLVCDFAAIRDKTADSVKADDLDKKIASLGKAADLLLKISENSLVRSEARPRALPGLSREELSGLFILRHRLLQEYVTLQNGKLVDDKDVAMTLSGLHLPDTIVIFATKIIGNLRTDDAIIELLTVLSEVISNDRNRP